MSIRRVTCPGCNTAVNVPVAMANVRCPTCGMVWNVKNPGAAPKPAAKTEAGAKPDQESKDAFAANAAIVGGVIGAVLLLLVVIGIVIVILNRDPPPSQAAADTTVEVEETIKPREPQEYRIIKKSETIRKQIYKDYRGVARTTIEKPLAVPQGSIARKNLEEMLQKTYDREINRFAALHDVTVQDIEEVIKEGDAKVWDDSPRSNAVRGGIRVYPKEMSEGWTQNPNRKPGI